MLTAAPETGVSELLRRDVDRINALANEHDLLAMFEHRDLLSVVVVDEEDRLVGRVAVAAPFRYRPGAVRGGSADHGNRHHRFSKFPRPGEPVSALKSCNAQRASLSETKSASLSPRPDRFTRMVCSLLIFGASRIA